MSKLFYRYFPIFALIVVLGAFLTWTFVWQMKKPQEWQKMHLRLENAGASESIEPKKLKGIPGRYDFDFESFSYEMPNGVINTGDFEFLTYSTRPHMAIIGFKDALELQWLEHDISIEGHPLRVSLEFDELEKIQTYIVEGKSGKITFDGAPMAYRHLVLAHDPNQGDAFAMRFESEEGEEITLTSGDFDTVMTEFTQNYLQ